MNPQGLITTLKNQHRTLQASLNLALENSKLETESKEKDIAFFIPTISSSR